MMPVCAVVLESSLLTARSGPPQVVGNQCAIHDAFYQTPPNFVDWPVKPVIPL